MIVCKSLKRFVPRAGVEPARPCGQRILRTLERVPRSLTKRYEPVFTHLAVVKVSLRLATYQHVRPPSWPHLLSCYYYSLSDPFRKLKDDSLRSHGSEDVRPGTDSPARKY